MKEILSDIRKTLKDNVDEKTLETGQSFFKEEILFYGVKIPMVNKISKESFEQVKNRPKAEIFALCEELWKSGYNEEAYIACNWSYYLHGSYEPSDFDIFARWVEQYVTNWATCDTLCNHTIGTLVEMYPQHITQLRRWVLSPSRWVKRAAAVTLIIPARKGLFLNDIFYIADMLLLDKDDMVQKGYGWMLKAASEAYRTEIFDYVISKRDVMPRVSLRYAIEKMPADMKAKAMRKQAGK